MGQQEGMTLLQLANMLNGIVREMGEEKAAELPVELIQDLGKDLRLVTVDRLVSVWVLDQAEDRLSNSSDLQKAEKIALVGPSV